jgi:hypothetical protein
MFPVKFALLYSKHFFLQFYQVSNYPTLHLTSIRSSSKSCVSADAVATRYVILRMDLVENTALLTDITLVLIIYMVVVYSTLLSSIVWRLFIE